MTTRVTSLSVSLNELSSTSTLICCFSEVFRPAGVLLLNSFTSLKSFEIQFWDQDDPQAAICYNFLHHLSPAHQFTSFGIEMAQIDGNGLLHFLRERGQSLQALSLSRSSFLGGGDGMDWARMESLSDALRGLTQMRYLNLHGWPLSPTEYITVVSNMPNLHTLDMSQYPNPMLRSSRGSLLANKDDSLLAHSPFLRQDRWIQFSRIYPPL